MDIYKSIREEALTTSKLKRYLAAGNPVDELDPLTGLAPLATAAKFGQIDATKVLLNNKAGVNKKAKYGCTPLYFAVTARVHREEIVKLLIDHNAEVDLTDDLCDNETPLMVAITRARDSKIAAMLHKAGASLQVKNCHGETAQYLADLSGNAAIRNAIASVDQQYQGLFEFVIAIVNFAMFTMTYFNSGLVAGITKRVVSSLYHLTVATEQKVDVAIKTDSPATVEDIKEVASKFVEDSDLSQFFPPGSEYLENVAENVVDAVNDPENYLKDPEQIKGLVQLALYQPVFYCGRLLVPYFFHLVPPY